jgi:DNA-binding transcriptional MerR regulator
VKPVDADHGVYGISVAAELTGIGVQNLRFYEARGLLEPDRTEGGARRYSANDIDRLRRIADLLAEGLNLAGIAMVLELQDANAALRAEKEEQQWPASTPASTRRRRSQSPTSSTSNSSRRSSR